MAPVGGTVCAASPRKSLRARLADVAAHPGNALLEDRALGERPALKPEACLQLGPDAVVGPVGKILVGAALDEGG